MESYLLRQLELHYLEPLFIPRDHFLFSPRSRSPKRHAFITNITQYFLAMGAVCEVPVRDSGDFVLHGAQEAWRQQEHPQPQGTDIPSNFPILQVLHGDILLHFQSHSVQQLLGISLDLVEIYLYIPIFPACPKFGHFFYYHGHHLFGAILFSFALIPRVFRNITLAQVIQAAPLEQSYVSIFPSSTFQRAI